MTSSTEAVVQDRDLELLKRVTRVAEELRNEIEKRIVGQHDVVEGLLTSLLANGHVLIFDNGPHHRGMGMRTAVIEDGDASSLADDHQVSAISSREERLLFIYCLDATDRIPLTTLWCLVGPREIGVFSWQNMGSLRRHGRSNHGCFAPGGPFAGSSSRPPDATSSPPFHSPDNLHPCG